MDTKVSNEIKEILLKLTKLQSDMDYVKGHIKDEDIFLTMEEEELLKKSHENEKAGKLVSSKQLRKVYKF